MGKNIRDEILSTEYSFVFDEKRKDMMCQSFYKYGKASKNYKSGNIDAIGCIEKCLEKFKETKKYRISFRLGKLRNAEIYVPTRWRAL